jgi:mono/diheme cytochrome c family protein
MSNPISNNPSGRLPAAYTHGDRGESNDVMDIHAAVLREQPEPKEGFEPLNLWMVVFIAGLLFFAGSYLTRYSGGFRANHFDETHINDASEIPNLVAAAPDPNQAFKALGGKVFRENCAICHNDAGEGKPGIAPPVAASDWVSTNGIARITRLILEGGSGPITVSGVEFNVASAAMVGFRATLTDEQIAAVITFLRSTWGNSGDAVKPSEVAAIRAATADRAGKGWTIQELMEIPVSGAAPAAPAAELTPDVLKEKLKALPPDTLKALLEELGKK